MTREQLTFITADDIWEIEFCCTNDRCNARVSYPVGKGLNLPAQCPSCNTPWFTPVRDDGRKKILYDFVDSLKKMRELKSPFTLRMLVSSDHVGDDRV